MTKSALTIVMIVITSALAGTQVKSSAVRPEKNFADLFVNAASSRYVLVGRAVKYEIFDEKQPPNKTAGMIVTIAVERTLCRQRDFVPLATDPAPDEPREFVHLLTKEFRPVMDTSTPVPAIGRRYLLFLSFDEKQQAQWLDAFSIDPARTYYSLTDTRVVPAGNGSPVPEPTVETEVARLCEAVAPPELATKQANLKVLVQSGDPILRREATIGLAALRQAARPPQSP